MLRDVIRRSLAVAFALALAAPVAAQDVWPNRPVRIVVPFPPGGSTDAAARPYAEKLGQLLGQPFVIENRGGATGALGMEAVAKAAPDGYTITISAMPSVAAVPALRRDLPYQWFDDFAMVGRITRLGLVVAVNASVPASTMQELVEHARKQGGSFNFGTAGIGSLAHFTGERLKVLGGFQAQHIPYRGSAEAMNDFLAGHVQMMHDGVVLPHLKAGKGKLLAYIDDVRHPDFPDVPLLSDSYPDWDIYAWFGILAPAKTPRPIIDKLSAALNQIADMPDMKERLWPQGQRPMKDTPEDMATQVKRDYAIYKRLVEELKIDAR